MRSLVIVFFLIVVVLSHVGSAILTGLLIIGAFMVVLGAWSKKTGRSTIVWGLLLGAISAYGLGLIK